MFRYRITAAPLEAWLDTGNSLELFGIADAQHIDSDDLAQTHADRYKLLVWTETPTDVEGCVTLIDGVPLTQQLCPLSSPKCPVLCLVDELQRAVWLRVDRFALRKPGGETAFDGRSLPSKRAYLQCVLVSNVIFGKYGVPSCPSGRVQGYYQLLLHGKDKSVSSKEYQKRWRDCPQEPPALRDVTSLPKRPRRDAGVVVAADPGPGEGDTDCPGDAADGPSLHEEPLGPAGIAPALDVAGDPGPPPLAHPENIDGARVVLARRADGGEGLLMQCTHAGCEKYRPLRLDPYGHGPRAAEYFLGAWLTRGVGTTREGHRAPPTRAQVCAYAESHAD